MREDVAFAELGVPERLVAALAKQGIDAPFPIQVATLPDTGRKTVIFSGRDSTNSWSLSHPAIPQTEVNS